MSVRSQVVAIFAFAIAGCATTPEPSYEGLFNGAHTKDDRFVQYIENWRNKVESVGNQNYPETVRGKIYGTVYATVTIASDGAVKAVEINRSSGYKVLDDAVKNIAKTASPYAPFPPEIRRDTDIIEITRTWTFGTTVSANPISPLNTSQSEADWALAIRDKIRSNIVLPRDTPADIKAVFSVVQLPSGEISRVALKSSSGFLTYDQAVESAIVKSSPLPNPSDPRYFRRNLELRFTPCDSKDPPTIKRQGKCS